MKCLCVILVDRLFTPDVVCEETDGTSKSKMDTVDAANRDGMCGLCRLRWSTEALQACLSAGLQSYGNHKCVHGGGHQNLKQQKVCPVKLGTHCTVESPTATLISRACTKQGRFPLTDWSSDYSELPWLIQTHYTFMTGKWTNLNVIL